MKSRRLVRRICLVLLAALLVGLPQASAYYYKGTTIVTSSPITAVWINPSGTSYGYTSLTTAPNHIARTATDEYLTVMEGVNEGYYAFVLWGGSGGKGNTITLNDSVIGAGGCVRGIAYFDAGTYRIRVATKGSIATSATAGYQPGAPHNNANGGIGYYIATGTDANHVGGGGGGYTAIFKGTSATQGALVAVAGGGGGSAGTGNSGTGTGQILPNPASGGDAGSYPVPGTPAPGNSGGNVATAVAQAGAGGNRTHPSGTAHGGGQTNYNSTAGYSFPGVALGGGIATVFYSGNPPAAPGGGGGGAGYFGGGGGGTMNRNAGGGGGGSSWIQADAWSYGADFTPANLKGTPAGRSGTLSTRFAAILATVNSSTEPNRSYSLTKYYDGKATLIYLGPNSPFDDNPDYGSYLW